MSQRGTLWERPNKRTNRSMVQGVTDQPNVGAPVLGPNPAANPEGFRSIRPSTIFLGGDSTGLVTHITWNSWGSAEAIGHGQSWYVSPNASCNTAACGAGPEAEVNVVAYNLMVCDGRRTYESVGWFFPEYGQTLQREAVTRCPDRQAGGYSRETKSFLETFLSAWWSGNQSELRKYATDAALTAFSANPNDSVAYHLAWDDGCQLGTSGAGSCEFLVDPKSGGHSTIWVASYHLLQNQRLRIDSIRSSGDAG